MLTATSQLMRNAAGRTLRVRRIQRLLAWVLVTSIVAYPLLGTMVAFTEFPSLLASIPARLLVLFSSAVLIIRSRHQGGSMLLRILFVFWTIYSVRLFVDLWNPVIPGSDMDIALFFASCVIPAVAVTRAQGFIWDEALIARWLAVTGAATCLLALLPWLSGMGGERSLLEETSRLSFDTVNPITYGHVAVTTILGSIVALRKTRRFRSRLFWIACIAVAGTALQLADSRGPLVALGACLVSLALCSRGMKRFAVTGLCVAAVFLALSLLGDSSILQRFSNLEDDPSTHERFALQANAIQQFLDNPLLGSAHLELDFLTYPHNPLIEAGMAIGAVGFLMFTILLLAMALRIYSRLRRGDILIPLLGLQYLLAAQFSGSLFQSNVMWILMALLFISGKRRRARTARVQAPVATTAAPTLRQLA